MNMMFRKISVCLLLFITMIGASARSEHIRDERQEQESPRSGYGTQRSNTSHQGWQNHRGDSAEPVRNTPRGRLSPDERRTLRQQINEVGRDIYPRKR